MQIKIEKGKTVNWLAWIVLVILWNYGFPEAKPIEDVLIAVILSLLLVLVNRLSRARRKRKLRR
jgi:hypothetical protein|tara:strand:+ start:28 stop:219 length:192 start_codon:yes stop_codon:yes gene_type:complete